MLLDSTAANVSQATVPTPTPAPTPASSTLREGADNRDSASSAEEVNQGEHFLTTWPCKLCYHMLGLSLEITILLSLYIMWEKVSHA